MTASGWGSRGGWLAVALALYAVLSLVSMATMSIGAAVLGVALVLAPGAPGERWGCGALAPALGELMAGKLARRYLGVSLALVATGLLSLLVARWDPLSYGGKHAEVHFPGDLAKTWYFLWPLVVALAFRRIPEAGRGLVARSWLLAFLALSCVGVIQYFTGWPRAQAIPGHEGRFHAILFLGHHLSVASVFIFPFFACLDYLRAPGLRPDPRLGRAWLAAAAGVGAVTLFLTYSRTLWVALPIGIIAWTIWSLPRRHGWKAALALLLAAAALSQVPAVHDRIFQDIGIATRRDLWNANWEFFKARPLTGVGWFQNTELSIYYLQLTQGVQDVFIGHAHDNLLNQLSTSGLIGTVAWLAWWWVVFQVCAGWGRGGAEDGFPRALACGLLVYHLNGLTQVNFWEGKVLHQLTFMIGWALSWRERP